MRLLVFRILFFATLCLSSIVGRASHLVGGELAFKPVSGSPNRYHITARLYRDASPTNVTLGSLLELYCASNGCLPTQPGNFTVPLTLTQRRSYVSACNPTNLWPFEMGVFEGDVTLPPARWTLSIYGENRNSGILNLVEPNANSMYIAATLDNSSGLVDSSPTFTSFTLPSFINNELSGYSFSAFDVDGDSLVYTSAQPLAGLVYPGSYLGTCSTPISYSRSTGGDFVDPITGARIAYGPVQFTPAFPFLTYQVAGGNAAPFFQLSAATGELLTRPVIIGYQSVAVRVDEYRRLGGSWQQIGSVTRDIVFRTPNGAGNHNPTITEVRVAGASVPQPIERVIPVRPGQLISLQLTATDPDAGQILRMSSDVDALIPGAAFQTLSAGQAQLSWQVPPQQPLGRYSFTVTAEDNGCPTTGLEVRTITFLVTNQVLATRSRQLLTQPAYPTPFHEQVQFQLAARKAQAVVIVDELGRLVEQLTSKADGTVVWQPAATVRPGLYIARTADGLQVQRLVRQ
jgi:hypothetical protein